MCVFLRLPSPNRMRVPLGPVRQLPTPLSHRQSPRTNSRASQTAMMLTRKQGGVAHECRLKVASRECSATTLPGQARILGSARTYPILKRLPEAWVVAQAKAENNRHADEEEEAEALQCRGQGSVKLMRHASCWTTDSV